jgi:hypothetical protein
MKFRLAALPLILLSLTAAMEVGPRPKDGDKWIELDQLKFGPGEGRRTTHYQLEVNDRGRARVCRVVRTSGDEVFDKSLCDQLRKNARFERATGSMFQDSARHYSGYFYSDPRR